MFPDIPYGRAPFVQHPNPQIPKTREQMLEQNWSDPSCNPNDITDETVLGYFCRKGNPFYDHTNCLNETEKMQMIMPGQISSWPGVQYTVAHFKQPLFIIRKIIRDNQRIEKTLEIYAVMNGVVYQLPDLGAVLNSRISTSLFHIREAFTATLPHLNYNSSKGFHWDSDVAASSTSSSSGVCDDAGKESSKTSKTSLKESTESEPSNPLDCKSTWFQRTRVDGLLVKLTERFPVDPDQQVPVKQEPGKPVEKADPDRITALKNEHNGGGVGGGNPGSTQSRASSRQSGSGAGSQEPAAGAAATAEPPAAKRIKVEN